MWNVAMSRYQISTFPRLPCGSTASAVAEILTRIKPHALIHHASGSERVDAPASGEPRGRRSLAVRARVAAGAARVAPDRHARGSRRRRRRPVQGGADPPGVFRVPASARRVDAPAAATLPGGALPPEDTTAHRARCPLDRRYLERGVFPLAGRHAAEAVPRARPPEGLDAAAAGLCAGPDVRRAVAGAVRRRARGVCR